MNAQSQEHYNKLVTCLKGMIGVYRSLLKIVRQEKEILSSANLDELNENNKAKEAMFLKVRDMEKERIELAKNLAASEGLPEDRARLLEFARHLGGETGEQMRNIHSVLELLLKRVRELNAQNEALVQSALTSITGAMNAIRDTLKDKPTYQNKGEIASNAAPAGQLVSREA